jgi:hypothetical protein
MMIIRKEQFVGPQCFREQGFINQMTVHLCTCVSKELAELDDSPLQWRIAGVMLKARSYDLHSKQDICRFLNLCAMFSCDFDEQFGNSWMHAQDTPKQTSGISA